MWRKPVGLGAKRTTGGMGRIVGVVFIGAHVSIAGGIHTAIDRAEEMGADSVQVFTQSPRMWRPSNHLPENLERFKERRAEVGLGGVLCHAMYLVNLASPKDDFYEKSVATMVNSVDVGSAIEADGVVFHIGSHLGAGLEAGLDRVVEGMKPALDRCSETTWLLMENTAGTGATIGRSIEELAALYERLDRHPRLGICLDSCHLYATGYDVTDEAALDETLVELDREIGLDRLRALHVNDSAAPLGSNRDRHANIGDGLMGKKLATFLGHPRLQGLPAVLEVPGVDGDGPNAEEVAKAKKLHRSGVRASKAKAPGTKPKPRSRAAKAKS
jgi:deoxyribonuclease-4